MSKEIICIVGLGYVGLPLAVEFAHNYKVIGFDVDESRIEELTQGFDRTNEIQESSKLKSDNLFFTSNDEALREASVYIITVPTPITDSNQPDTRALVSASTLVSKYLSDQNLVVYESTVYPGLTEEICLPILEQTSGLKVNTNFHLGYSPERINPGDHDRKLVDIVKVVSGHSTAASERVQKLYGAIIKAGVYTASSIKVAEAAKVIENTQRDINIALMNELSMIFNKMGIDTNEVLEAAGTKWNFLPFRPGLVGGHCIGVDPYYLAYKSSLLSHHPEIIMAGRKINDDLHKFIVYELQKKLNINKINFWSAPILIIGATFKENCPDLRNSRVFNLVDEIENCGGSVEVYDPVASHEDLLKLYPDKSLKSIKSGKKYAAILLAVPHEEILEMGIKNIKSSLLNNGVFFDLKGAFEKSEADFRL